MTDRERIRRIQSGEPEQMNELIETYYQEIFQYCYSRTRRESAAYDCTQETFLRVIRYLKGETVSLTEEEAGQVAWPKNGWILVCVDGWPLGWAKNAGAVLKNKYYPGWRWQ